MIYTKLVFLQLNQENARVYLSVISDDTSGIFYAVESSFYRVKKVV